jgi:hypothetical protein
MDFKKAIIYSSIAAGLAFSPAYGQFKTAGEKMDGQTSEVTKTKEDRFSKGADYLYKKYGDMGKKVTRQDYYDYIKAFQIPGDKEFRESLGIKSEKDSKKIMEMPSRTKQELAEKNKVQEKPAVTMQPAKAKAELTPLETENNDLYDKLLVRLAPEKYANAKDALMQLDANLKDSQDPNSEENKKLISTVDETLVTSKAIFAAYRSNANKIYSSRLVATKAAQAEFTIGNIDNAVDYIKHKLADIQRYASAAESRGDKDLAKLAAEYAISSEAEAEAVRAAVASGNMSANAGAAKLRAQGEEMLQKEMIDDISKMMKSFILYINGCDKEYLERFDYLHDRLYKIPMSPRSKELYHGIIDSYLAKEGLLEQWGGFFEPSGKKADLAEAEKKSFRAIEPLKSKVLSSLNAETASKGDFAEAIVSYSEVLKGDYSFMSRWVDFRTLGAVKEIGASKPLELSRWLESNYITIQSDRAAFENFRKLVATYYGSTQSSTDTEAVSAMQNRISDINAVLSKMTVMDLRLLCSALSRMQEKGFKDNATYAGLMETLVSISKLDPYLFASYLGYAVPGFIDISSNDKDIQMLFPVVDAGMKNRITEGVLNPSERDNMRQRFMSISSDLPSMSMTVGDKDLLYDIWKKSSPYEGLRYYDIKQPEMLNYENYFMNVAVPLQSNTLGFTPNIANYRSGEFAYSQPGVYPGAFSFFNRENAKFYPGLTSFSPRVPDVYKIRRHSINQAMQGLSGIMARRYGNEEFYNDFVNSTGELAAGGFRRGDETFVGTGAKVVARTVQGGGVNGELSGGKAQGADDRIWVNHDVTANRVTLGTSVERAAEIGHFEEERYASETANILFPFVKDKGDMLVYFDGRWALQKGDKAARTKEGWYLVRDNGETYRAELSTSNEYALLKYQFGEANAKKWLASEKIIFDKETDQPTLQGTALGVTVGNAAAAGVFNNILFYDKNGTDMTKLVRNAEQEAISASWSSVFGKRDNAVIATYRGTELPGKGQVSFTIESTYRDVPPSISDPAWVLTGIGGTRTGGARLKTEKMMGLDGLGGNIVYSGISNAEAYGIQASVGNFVSSVYGWKRNDANNTGAFVAGTYMYSMIKDQASGTSEQGYGMATLLVWAKKFNLLVAGEKKPWMTDFDRIMEQADREALNAPNRASQIYNSAFTSIENILKSNKYLQDYALGVGYDGKIYLVAATDLKNYSNLRGAWLLSDASAPARAWLEAVGATYRPYGGANALYSDIYAGAGVSSDRPYFSAIRAMAGPTVLINANTKGVAMVRGGGGEVLVKLLNQNTSPARKLKADLIAGFAIDTKTLTNEELNEYQAMFTGMIKKPEILTRTDQAFYVVLDRKNHKINVTDELGLASITHEKDWNVTTGYEFARVEPQQIDKNFQFHVTYGRYMDVQDYWGVGAAHVFRYLGEPRMTFGVTVGYGPLPYENTDIWSQNYMSRMRMGRYDWSLRGDFKLTF